ncbi:MAG: 16S rRNA (uracil(1498)-N(3))-methyltransferase [Tropheryma whipplei]|uniref:Ribosomal RNA small subunit methyltransferase E n=1 Tax=Tropheryma whipplei (strain Twist) TaxID=203267 RepID=Q83GJ2_TROWT|nr:16S rRNA (uracil(1498)-N(3))-methyltransferase [Tropheryma whipplei]AAO44378.1 unknown [Tropheryma whipplei str. Twist]MCO8182641.1 16S rRNA (uracil(1498)-N(3))-methyltransferase [Tropheryma whipplei]MCO8190226.1 16S rRNA (uracil(1498)-N(3))-methyltransferase [Tropheryma whipplei]CAD67158.1 conserved hypothetical protein [Tropheryma whipplei TW08/27]
MSGFFIAENLSELSEGDTVFLSDREQRHACLSRRIRVGEEIGLTDTMGRTANARVTVSSQPGTITARIMNLTLHKPNRVTVSLLQALCRRASAESAVRSAVELGVDRIVPWKSDRSFNSSSRRWSSIAREAAKQSRRAWFPVVKADIPSERLVEEIGDSLAIILDPGSNTRLSSLGNLFLQRKSVFLLIGPEGGITREEISTIPGICCSLGIETLKSSTASVAALSLVNFFLGRW